MGLLTNKRPEATSHKDKSTLVYPGFDNFDTWGHFGATLTSLIRSFLSMSDEELAKKNLKKAQGRNPPLLQTNYTAPAEEEDQYWPSRSKYPLSPILSKDWYDKLWGKFNTLGSSRSKTYKYNDSCSTSVVGGVHQSRSSGSDNATLPTHYQSKVFRRKKVVGLLPFNRLRKELPIDN